VILLEANDVGKKAALTSLHGTRGLAPLSVSRTMAAAGGAVQGVLGGACVRTQGDVLRLASRFESVNYHDARLACQTAPPPLVLISCPAPSRVDQAAARRGVHARKFDRASRIPERGCQHGSHWRSPP